MKPMIKLLSIYMRFKLNFILMILWCFCCIQTRADGTIWMNALNIKYLSESVYGRTPFYYVHPEFEYKIDIGEVLNGNVYRISEIYIDNTLIASRVDNKSYTMDLSEYCDGNRHKLTIKWVKNHIYDYSSAESVCYFINTANFPSLTSEEGIFYEIHENEAYVVGSIDTIEDANIKNVYEQD